MSPALPSRLARAAAGTVGAAALGLAALTGVAAPAAAEVIPICFPVFDTPTTYVGNFGDPRGDHVHEGEDIMGEKMFRLVATVDGRILSGTDGIRWTGNGYSDHSLRILGDDGNYYAYLHMNDDTPGTDDGAATYEEVFGPGIAPGARVRAGQLVGYLGDSGNAESAGPHLHFEIRRGSSIWSSTAIDPYDSLQAARRCSPGLNSPTHPYTALGGFTDAAPDLASQATGGLDMFVRGGDGQMWHRAWVDSTFTAWRPLGGGFRSGPGAVAPTADRMDVFARGLDDQLWQRTRIDGAWGPWQPRGGLITSGPDAASSGNGEIAVTATGGDGQVWLLTFDGSSWSDWRPLGGASPNGPSVASPAEGRLAVYVRGGDGALWWRNNLDDGRWTDWNRLGGGLTSAPDVTVESGGLHVVARGTDQRLWYLDHTGGDPWRLISLEKINFAPSIASWGDDRLDVLAVGTDGALYQTWWLGAAW